MSISYDRLNAKVRNKFGVDSIYTPTGGDPRTVKVIVEEDYFSGSPGVGVQTATLVAKVVDADVPELAVGDIFTWSAGRLAGSYEAKEIKPDFHGMTDIVLNKA